MEVTGDGRALLAAERTALNFLQRLSGIASRTRAYVVAVRGTAAKIMNTRKTTPMLRDLERYAVVVGGGVSHRRGLFDAVLLKENHFALAQRGYQDTVRAAVEAGLGPVIAEAQNLDEALAAVAGGVAYTRNSWLGRKETTNFFSKKKRRLRRLSILSRPRSSKASAG